MRAGKIIHWDRLEFSLACHFSYERSNDQVALTGRAQLSTRYTPDQFSVVSGICLSLENCTGSESSECSRVYGLEIPALGVEKQFRESGWKEFLSTGLELHDVRLYCTLGGRWRLLCGRVLWSVEDQLYESFEGFELLSDLLCPSSIPLLGIPAMLSSSCMIDPMPFLGYGRGGVEHEGKMECRGMGGWRFMIGGAWEALPVRSVASGVATAADTYRASVHSRVSSFYREVPRGSLEIEYAPDGQKADEPAVLDMTGIKKGYQSVQGSIVLVPDLPKSVRRMNPDYAALIYRGPFPSTYVQARHLDSKEHYSGINYFSRESAQPQESLRLLHEGCPESYGVIRAEMHPLETPLEWSSHAPYHFEELEWEVQDIEFTPVKSGVYPLADGEIHGPVPDYSRTDQRWIRERSYSESFPYIHREEGYERVLPGLRHHEALPAYMNTIVHPQWSFLYWFPKGSEWSLCGKPLKAADYWLPVKSQMLDHPSLLSSERTFGKTELVSAPLSKEGVGKEIEELWLGVPTSWWGICRFVASPVRLDAQVALDARSAPEWKVSSCRAEFLEKIGVHFGSWDVSGPGVLQYNIGHFEHPPFMVPALCARLSVGWDVDNVQSCRVYLMNAEGDKRLLCEAPGAYSFSPALEQAYTGSWSVDRDLGVFTPYGSDLRAEGCSGKYMADVHRGFHFGLLQGRSAAWLRFEVVPKDPALPCFIHYPVFHTPHEDVRVIHEDARRSCLIWPGGAGVRWGQWDWCPSGQFKAFPVLRDGGTSSTVVDWLCWDHCVFKGDFRGERVQESLRSLYDEEECSELSEASKHTHSFLVQGGKGGVGVLVNHLAEVPPLAHFPTRARLERYWPAGGWAQESWSYAQEPRYYVVSGSQPLHLYVHAQSSEDLSMPITSLSKEQVPGWVITQHSYPCRDPGGGAERCRVVVGGQEIAVTSGWHGCFAVVGLGSRKRRYPWNFYTEYRGYHRVYCSEGELVYQIFEGPRFAKKRRSLQTLTHGGDCCGVRMVEGADGRLYMLYGRVNGGDFDGVYECSSDDHGLTWSVSKMIFPGGKYPVLFVASNGLMLKAAFVPSEGSGGSGHLRAFLCGHGEALEGSDLFTFTKEDGGELVVQEDTFHIVEARDGTAGWILTASVEGEEEPSDWYSADNGRTWRRITDAGGEL